MSFYVEVLRPKKGMFNYCSLQVFKERVGSRGQQCEYKHRCPRMMGCCALETLLYPIRLEAMYGLVCKPGKKIQIYNTEQ